MMFGYGGTGGSWPVWAVALMWIGMLVLLGVLIWVGYILMTNAARRPRPDRGAGPGIHGRRGGVDARGVLDQRLARGEIDAAEDQRLRGLIAAGDDQAPAGAESGR